MLCPLLVDLLLNPCVNIVHPSETDVTNVEMENVLMRMNLKADLVTAVVKSLALSRNSMSPLLFQHRCQVLAEHCTFP